MNLTSNEENVVKLELMWLSYLIFHLYFPPNCLALDLFSETKQMLK